MEALIRKIAREIAGEGGQAWYAGGYVRDRLLGRDSEDYDVEVHGLPLARLEPLLRRHGAVRAVGRAFGVLKFVTPEGEADFSIPRRENKEGSGHRGFVVDLDPSITPEEACSRRDFTVNAMLMKVLDEDEVLDFFGGRADLEARVLRRVGPSFGEDPLRAYRLMQFAARLEMEPEEETLAACAAMDLSELAAERVFEEFAKLLLLARRPSLGLEAARQAGILRFHPELADLVGCLQDPRWHPEGDVWTHTLKVVDQAARLRTGDRQEDLVLMFGGLCHDLGKPATTFTRDDGRIVSPGHCEAGLDPARRFMERLTREQQLIEGVLQVVKFHLRPAELYRVRDQVGDAAIRRLAVQVNIEDLVRWARADHLGRGTEDARAEDFPAGQWLLERAAELKVRRLGPEPLLLGRHLLERGWEAGPALGERLREAFEAQLEGRFEDLEGALRWLEEDRHGQ